MSIGTGPDEGRGSILCTGGRGEGEGGMRGGGTSPCTSIEDVSDAHDEDGGQGRGEGREVWGV